MTEDVRKSKAEIIAKKSRLDEELKGLRDNLLNLDQKYLKLQEAHKQLRARENLFFNLVDNLPDPALAIEPGGKVIAWNKAMAALTGVAPEDMLGLGDYACALPFFGVRRPMLCHLLFEPTESVIANYPAVIRTGDVLIEEFLAPNLKPEAAYFWSGARAIIGSHGRIVAAIQTFRDITSHRATLESMRGEIEELAAKQAALEEQYRFCAGELKAAVADRERIGRELAESDFKLANAARDFEQRNKEIDILCNLADLLQACRTKEEAYGIVARSAEELFPHDSCALYLYGTDRKALEVVSTWGGKPAGNGAFEPEACWAVRRGKAHLVEDPAKGQVCPHLSPPPAAGYLCMPISAQGEMLGLLHLRFAHADPATPEKDRAQLFSAKQRLATNVAEQFALCLGNLDLREQLRRQSVRDPLTGLFNRRYMEESLAREARRADREGKPTGIIMADVDRFHFYNEALGHEPGDALLRDLGQFFQKSVRGEDVACRYGGDVFILILPGASVEVASKRAEQLREGVKSAVRVTHAGRPLPPVTISLGVAVYPLHGKSPEETLKAAERATHKAKQEGRDHVSIAGSDE